MSRFILIILCMALVACGSDTAPTLATQTPFVVTATVVPATQTPYVITATPDEVTDTPVPTAIPVTDTPMPTVTPDFVQGDPDCFGGRFPSGYLWASANWCLRGEIHKNDLWDEYDIDDERVEYWFGDNVTPYQYVRGDILGIPLLGVPAWINALTNEVYRGQVVNALNIEITEINGRFGIQYSQDFVFGQCYNFKFYVRPNITQGFNPTVADIRMEIYTTNENRTLFNVHEIRNPYAETEFTWIGFTRDNDASGAILMYLEMRYPQMHGNLFVYSAGTLRAPQSDCFDQYGMVRPNVYEF